MARLPVNVVYMHRARTNPPEGAIDLFRALSERLRNDPMPEDIELAATLFQRIVDRGADNVRQALYLSADGAPRRLELHLEMYEAVQRQLDHGAKAATAYRAVAADFSKAASTVKKIYLSLNNALNTDPE